MASISSENADGLVMGYPGLGQRMGRIPEQVILRRFSALGAEDLLYQQAELVSLENELHAIQRADSEHSGESVDWTRLRHSSSNRGSEQWELLLKIRAKLKEYNSALLLQSKITGLPKPDIQDLTAVQNFLWSPNMGLAGLIGADATVWGSILNPASYSVDLFSLVATPTLSNEDMVSNFIGKAIVHLFNWSLHVLDRPGDLLSLPNIDSILLRFTFLITNVVASLLPVAAISILYSAQSTRARLAIIAGVNFVVALSLTTFTTAKRADVFAVVAAFSAIQAVFIGSNSGSGCS
ncbi:MAG: hypothetical protein M1822_004481 [Bathelium mastoideum]|nr:MAG: hypothetical protein M1822_004481 [Bathelium mastoideum]